MEFSFKISESEFRQAWRVERRASSRSSFKTAAFWMLIMIGLLLIYRAMTSRPQAGTPSQHLISQASIVRPVGDADTPGGLLERVGPILVLAGLWILIVTGLVPMRLHYLYKRDPRMQGQFTINITQDSICAENTAGTTSKCSWNVFDYWSEGKNIIVLMFHSGSYSILSLAGLSEPQRGELRGILSAVLKKK